MARIEINRIAIRHLHHPPEIQHHHPVGNLPHDRKIMADENQRHAKIFLQFNQQIHNLRLNGNIERTHRLIADHQLGPHNHRPRNADTLVLPAGKFMRIAVDPARLQPHPRHHFAHLSSHLVA